MVLFRCQRIRLAAGSRCHAARENMKAKGERMRQYGTRWIPGLVAVVSTIIYVTMLILYSEQAKYTFQVSRMRKAEYCFIDFLGHKSKSLKQTSCCEIWLGVVCKSSNSMPCPSISVGYKLVEEDFVRAGYINYWNPHKLIAGYAANSHCMIVPITCPEPQEWKTYTQAEVNKGYTIKQSLDCYVYKDAPERPLLITAKLLPHSSLAALLFITPPIIILGALITCVILRSEVSEEDSEETISEVTRRNSDDVFICSDRQMDVIDNDENEETSVISEIEQRPKTETLSDL